MDTPLHERIAAGLATGAVMGLLGAALMIGLTVTMRRPAPNTPLLVDLQPPPPEPREKPVHPRARTRAARKPAPANLKRRPTDIVKPPPLVIPPPVPPVIAAAPVPGPGAAASAGASDRPGPGTGAGGEGNGRGGGGEGEGDGDFTPPRHIKGSLNYGDLPAPLRETGPSGAVMVRYRVGTDGRAGECMIQRSSGNAALDAATCDLIERKFRFRPSLDAAGRPVGSIITDETHTWILDREENDRR